MKYLDLHLHLDGSLSINNVKGLMKLNNIECNYSDNELFNILSVGDNCKDLNEYLLKFDFPCQLLQTKDSIIYAIRTLLSELKEKNYMYVEIRFAPQKHTKYLTQEEVVVAAIQGIKDGAIKANLILCAMRGSDNIKENLETKRLVKKYLNKGVVALDLAGAEALFPNHMFDYLLENLDVPLTIHSGEALGSESIYDALKYKPKRIGHGIRAVTDKKLMKILSDENILLELCPTSNLNTKIFNSYLEYPIDILLNNNVKVCINSDNMMVSNTDVIKEYERLNISEDLKKELIKNQILGSFLSLKEKEELLLEL
ncbi:MAG: adenosine deaminase [Anaeroplasmataceae bacterium]